tara:strand:- start:269 stop:1522 length:1254 start_codon:yes stop_codon:yes gene_type:complete
MSYNGNVETMYLDPVSFVPNGRCAFELDGTKLAYLSNMRLLNLGVVSNTQQDYSQGLGALAFIRNIKLMDARTELSQMRNPAQYLFFKNCNRTNATNKSEDSYLKRNSMGYEVAANDNKISREYTGGRADTTPDTTSLAYLDLREVFPILNSLTTLPTTVFKNLRIEIEFQANAAFQMLGQVDATFDIQRPILAVDIVNNQAMVDTAINSLMSAPILWQEIETDNYTINAVDTSGEADAGYTARQQSNNNSLGFRGKYVERLLVCKQLVNKLKEQNGQAVLGFGAVASSQALLNEQTQFRVNGKNIFAGFNGINKPNEMLAMVSDEYGSLNAYPGSNLYKWTKQAALNDDGNSGGQQAFSCVRLGCRVADLQVQIGRDNNRDSDLRAPTNDALNVNLYAEVSKMVNVGSNGYRIVYA